MRRRYLVLQREEGQKGATQHLERSCFVLDGGQKILVIGESHVDEHIDVTGVVYETIRFLQEVRPYLRILSDFL